METERAILLIIASVISLYAIYYIITVDSYDPINTVNNTEYKRLFKYCSFNTTECLSLLGPGAQIDCIYDCMRKEINSSYQSRNNILVVGSTAKVFTYKNETNL